MILSIVVGVEGEVIMAIKMRNNTAIDAECYECGETQEEVLNMFDLLVGKLKFTICDDCTEKLFNKTLRAIVMRNERAKSSRDMAIIRRRKTK